ncbi:hypothetical protein [Pelosinus sp. UFO1]|uniref:hypothetical protein n=1 Tax=Pelosinus sp. UFO1 TaxID=484770 RepID=UPI0004D0B654|nr:hypothetical protein [Pelosinus sp. UFO1]AIF50249.1 hypothetical protein UFO1_0694 [Pelosinus sp. UFO1]
MKKINEVRIQSKDKVKLIKGFHYVIDSDLNTWFKRTFLFEIGLRRQTQHVLF